MFEEKFLQSEHLRNSLSTKALNVNNKSPSSFKFSSLIPPRYQQTNAIKTNLVCQVIYHLRQRHPAIDAVCVAEEDNCRQKYLLLIQVSISPYKEHHSKGIDIRKTVDLPEKKHSCLLLTASSTSASPSVAKYYQCLGENIDDDKVIYVYISPKETEPPDDITFLPELRGHGTRGSTDPPAYWYGFIDSSMKNILEMIEKGLV